MVCNGFSKTLHVPAPWRRERESEEGAHGRSRETTTKLTPTPPKEMCGDDHAPVTRGRMRAQYPLPHGPERNVGGVCPARLPPGCRVCEVRLCLASPGEAIRGPLRPSDWEA